MKKALLLSTFVFLLFSTSLFAQKTDNEKKEVSIETLLDIDAEHNLNVAWQYFKQRKAYKAVLLRTDETLAAHPTFSKIDEVLFLSGMSSYYLLKGKGKQKLNYDLMSKEEKERFAPENLKKDAVAYLSMLVGEYPKSKYAGDAKDVLKKIKPKEDDK